MQRAFSSLPNLPLTAMFAMDFWQIIAAIVLVVFCIVCSNVKATDDDLANVDMSIMHTGQVPATYDNAARDNSQFPRRPLEISGSLRCNDFNGDVNQVGPRMTEAEMLRRIDLARADAEAQIASERTKSDTLLFAERSGARARITAERAQRAKAEAMISSERAERARVEEQISAERIERARVEALISVERAEAEDRISAERADAKKRMIAACTKFEADAEEKMVATCAKFKADAEEKMVATCAKFKADAEEKMVATCTKFKTDAEAVIHATCAKIDANVEAKAKAKAEAAIADVEAKAEAKVEALVAAKCARIKAEAKALIAAERDKANSKVRIYAAESETYLAETNQMEVAEGGAREGHQGGDLITSHRQVHERQAFYEIDDERPHKIPRGATQLALHPHHHQGMEANNDPAGASTAGNRAARGCTGPSGRKMPPPTRLFERSFQSFEYREEDH
ncbi:hypothetical protein IWQ60_000045 [Tieghemiomyces parasiticus]|uniref:Uncharacterized protein n=1 Tax=Tieghemiomyces parasiticus TaxID=78921 RepID=A0A9W8AJB6_9FUNG|nr:hypothetical protein IWQ60_000045 [Tieghemiomyces parasiticus]